MTTLLTFSKIAVYIPTVRSVVLFRAVSDIPSLMNNVTTVTASFVPLSQSHPAVPSQRGGKAGHQWPLYILQKTSLV